MTKTEIRKQMIKTARTTSKPTADEVANVICNLDYYKNAEIIFGYIALKSEIDVSEVINRAIRDGKKIAFPTIKPGVFILGDKNWKNQVVKLENKTCSLLYQSTSKTLTFANEKSIIPNGVILVPGLAFTEFGTRLGRGAGYYDQTNLILKSRKDNVNLTFIGVCMRSQIVTELPTEPHDMPVDVVLSF